MVLAIPGGRGLFSTLQTGLRHSDGHRVRINRHIRRQLDDFEALAKDLHLRPTRLGEIVRDTLSGIGACDAAGPGMGGVWFIPNKNPILWRSSFPVSIQKRLVTWSNPRGDLTNSDLELAAIVAQQDVLCQRIDTRERTFCTLTDNTPALSWARKGSVTSEAAAAYLLRLNSLHQRHHRYLGTYDHIAGKANVMADDASRLWNLRDSQLLAYFQQTYPQSLPWKFTPLRQHMRSALISALSRQPVALQSALNVPNRRITPGASGATFAPSTTSIPYYKLSQTQSLTYKSLHSGIGMADLPKMVNPSELAQWRTPYVPLARRWPAWGPKTTAWKVPTNSSTV